MTINQTHYGSGDNVAGDKVIINQQPQQRTLSAVDKTDLIDLIIDKSKKITIHSITGDIESYIFANEVKDFLKKNDYIVEGPYPTTYYGSPKIGKSFTTNPDTNYEIVIGQNFDYQ